LLHHPELHGETRKPAFRCGHAGWIFHLCGVIEVWREGSGGIGQGSVALSSMRRVSAVLGSVCFLLLAPGTVAGLVPWWISGWRVQAPLLGFSFFRWLGVLLILAGLPVLLDSFARFALKGLGTPAPVFPTRHLVVSGLYRYVRNPMYLALQAVIFGQGFLFGNVQVLEYGLLVWVGFHLFVLLYEEPTLRRSFGAEYENFCAQVGRWVPRLSAWDAGER
jgi:protein-S-isoprenylcysteine O-methyltransferase Ste14